VSASHGGQRGSALPLALLALTLLTVLVLAYLAVAAMEPTISRNLADGAGARAVAEAGLEWSLLAIAALDFTELLAGPDGRAGTADDAVPSGVSGLAASVHVARDQALPGLGGAEGRFTVTARNDSAPAAGSHPGDGALTGLGALDPGGDKVDTNGVLLLTATGEVSRGPLVTRRSIQVVVQRPALPVAGALSLTGLRVDVRAGDALALDGRDARVDDAWIAPTGTGALMLAIATPAGVQASVAPLTYEERARQAFDTAERRARLEGRDPAASGSARGEATIAADARASAAAVAAFLAEIAANPAVAVLRASETCPLTLAGDGTGAGNEARVLSRGGACPPPGAGATVDLGTRARPRVVYVRGDGPRETPWPALRLQGRLRGVGVLVVEEGALDLDADELEWEGLIVVAGRRVGTAVSSRARARLTGALLVDEREADAGAGPPQLAVDGALAVRASAEARGRALGAPALLRLRGWREDVACAGCP
jgi:hypothetical protein